MGGRRRHLFVLLFVLALVAVSALVIATKPTRLGLDLKGGTELIYQGEPTGQVKTVTPSDVDRALDIVRQRIDKFGVAEPEVARIGATQLSVSLPDVTNAQRAIDQVGTTAQLYFYNWEPNLVGIERAVGGTPGAAPPAGALTRLQGIWRKAHRQPNKLLEPAADPLRGAAQRLRGGEARLPAEAGPGLHDLLGDPAPLLPLCPRRAARPPRRTREVEEGPLRHPDREEAAAQRDRAHGAAGLDRRLRAAGGLERPDGPRGRARPGLVRAAGPAGALRHRHQGPAAELRPVQPAERHLQLHRQGTRGVPERHPPDRPETASPGRSARSAPPRPASSPVTSR